MSNRDKLRLFDPEGTDITDKVEAAHKKAEEKKKKKEEEKKKKKIQYMRIPVEPYKGK